MKKLLISSAKGGVGKTTTSVNLARAIARKGYKVGILDADISAPNVPIAMGITEKTPMEVVDYKLKPVVVDGIKVVSYWFDTINGIPFLLWSTDRTEGILRSFCQNVDWGEVDIVIYDCPPTSADELLGLINYLGHIDGVILILQGNTRASVEDAKLAKYTFDYFNVKVLGFIQNMMSDIFYNGDINVEVELGLKKIAEIPLAKEIDLSYYDPVVEFLEMKRILRKQKKAPEEEKKPEIKEDKGEKKEKPKKTTKKKTVKKSTKSKKSKEK